MLNAPKDSVTLMMVGDVILDEPDPDFFFSACRETFAQADVVVGHVEVPHTRRGQENSTDVPAPPADPDHLQALQNAGVHVATLAGNHIADSGPAGIEDTVLELRRLGIAPTGAGLSLNQALEPAIVEREGLKIGVLSFNCVGPRDSWATSRKAGCAYVKVLTHYELDHASPGGPPNIYTFAAPDSLDAMSQAIEALRQRVDTVVVALHKGVGHVPARIEMYERAVSRAAIEAGADVVIGHHAHIMRGIEIYKGKPIYHGLGNFVTVTRALSVSDNDSPERLAWAKRRQQLFGFAPDPDMPAYPFHPDSRNTAIACCRVGPHGQLIAGLIPCRIDVKARPVPLSRSAEAEAVLDYIRGISQTAGLKVRLSWEDDHFVRIDPV